MNNIMKYTESDNCCGCAACANVCPKKIIKMVSDDEGFLYPNVDESQCVECGLCDKVCAFNSNKKQEDAEFGKVEQEAYAAKNIDFETRMNSRSGGVFTALTDKCLENGGSVYGVALDSNYMALHSRATSKEERNLFRGSKYIQSNVGFIYQQVKKDLQEGRDVIFSGTPCQVNALKKYLFNVDCSKLVLVDIICHGVPSPRVWKDYLRYNEKCFGGKVTQVDFRNKRKYGWAASKESISINNVEHDSSLFIDLFNSGVIERPSCFKCPYKTIQRTGDVTIGDFWGINKVSKEFNDDKGVSLILCNTDKGKNAFYNIMDKLEVLKVDMKECLQPALMKPSEYPKDRKAFWLFYLHLGKIKFAKLYQYKLKVQFRLKNKKITSK